MCRFVAEFEDFHELLITTRDLFHRGVAGNLICAPIHKLIPEARAADRKANESRHPCRGREPMLDLTRAAQLALTLHVVRTGILTGKRHPDDV